MPSPFVFEHVWGTSGIFSFFIYKFNWCTAGTTYNSQFNLLPISFLIYIYIFRNISNTNNSVKNFILSMYDKHTPMIMFLASNHHAWLNINTSQGPGSIISSNHYSPLLNATQSSPSQQQEMQTNKNLQKNYFSTLLPCHTIKKSLHQAMNMNLNFQQIGLVLHWMAHNQVKIYLKQCKWMQIFSNFLHIITCHTIKS